MFQYRFPVFEKKHLLRAGMLEQLRDYPKNFLTISYAGFGDGILSGCGITWDNGRISIGPGIILHKGGLYLMNITYQMECLAGSRQRYLKVEFLAEENGSADITGNTKITLDETKPDPDYEMELCRFRLQEGARLRDDYESFEDYSTEYDTINLIHAPFAAEGGSTLNPKLLQTYAKEILRSKSQEMLDLVFSMNVLSGSGHIPSDCVCEYLYARSGEAVGGNMEAYRRLLEILETQKTGECRINKSNQGKRGVMLL